MFALNSLARWRRPRSEAQSSADLAFEETDPTTGDAMGFVEADWLLRVLLSCFGLTVGPRDRLCAVGSLRELGDELALRGLALRVSKFCAVRELRRGDVIRLDERASWSLCAAVGGSGLVVVVDAGASWLRLRRVCSEQVATCARGQLRSLRGSRMLRIEQPEQVSSIDTAWEWTWAGRS